MTDVKFASVLACLRAWVVLSYRTASRKTTLRSSAAVTGRNAVRGV